MVRDKIIFAILLPCAAIETDTQSARQILKILEEEIGKSLGLKLYAKSENNRRKQTITAEVTQSGKPDPNFDFKMSLNKNVFQID